MFGWRDHSLFHQQKSVLHILRFYINSWANWTYGLMDFYITSYKVGFAGVGINPIFLGLIILFFVVSKNAMDKLLPEKREVKTKTLDENLIKSFESKFVDKTVAELNGIADQNSKFTDNAKTAAKRILDKKNVL